MNFKSLEQLEEEKSDIWVNMMSLYSDLYTEELIKILKWFKQKFPKRKLKWVDGMGTNFWEIDGEIWDCDTEYVYHIANVSGHRYLKERAWTRKERLLKPLVDFQKSINDVTYTPSSGIYIGDMSTSDII